MRCPDPRHCDPRRARANGIVLDRPELLGRAPAARWGPRLPAYLSAAACCPSRGATLGRQRPRACRALGLPLPTTTSSAFTLGLHELAALTRSRERTHRSAHSRPRDPLSVGRPAPRLRTALPEPAVLSGLQGIVVFARRRLRHRDATCRVTRCSVARSPAAGCARLTIHRPRSQSVASALVVERRMPPVRVANTTLFAPPAATSTETTRFSGRAAGTSRDVLCRAARLRLSIRPLVETLARWTGSRLPRHHVAERKEMATPDSRPSTRDGCGLLGNPRRSILPSPGARWPSIPRVPVRGVCR